MSLEAAQALSLLLEGSADLVKTIYPVHKLLLKAPLQAQAGYSKLSRSFPLQQLLTCLRQNLTVNPFGITACLHSGKKLTWAQQGKLNDMTGRRAMKVQWITLSWSSQLTSV